MGVDTANVARRYLDEIWAKEHHEYWYRDMTANRGAPGPTPSAAAASPMKEGWKL